MYRNDGWTECFSTERYRMFDSSGNRELVNKEQIAGGTETCILIDGTVRRTPVAEIEIERHITQVK